MVYANGRLFSAAQTQWAPTLTFHAPFPPITVEDPNLEEVAVPVDPAPTATTTKALRVNGVVVAIFNGSVRRKPVRSGLRRGRSFRRQMRDSRRYVRRAWDCEVVIADHDDAVALERMLLGEGHFVDFASGLHAVSGLMPLGSMAKHRLLPSAWGAYGLGCIFFDAAVGDLVRYDAQLEDDWTVIAYVYDHTLRRWKGHGLRSDDLAVVDGAISKTFGFTAATGGAGFYFRVVDGVVAIVRDNNDGNAMIVDDLVILPWRASEAQLAAWTANPLVGTKFGPSPAVRVSGTLINGADPTGEILAVGGNVDVDIISKAQRVEGYGMVSNGRVVRFTIDEVDPAFVGGSLAPSALTYTPVPPGTPGIWIDATRTGSGPEAPTGSTMPVFNHGTRNPGQWAGPNPTLARFSSGDGDVVRGGPAYRFDGTSQWQIEPAASPASNPLTVAIVFKIDDVSAGVRTLLDSDPFRARIAFNGGSLRTQGGGGEATYSLITLGTTNGYRAVIASFKAANSAVQLDAYGSENEGDLSATSGPAFFTLGARFDGGERWDGDIPEALVWFADQAVADIVSYLEARYGRAFPQL